MNWYFGSKAGVSFNSGIPTALTNSTLSMDFATGTVSDAAGNLLFYTDGTTIKNRNHTTMLNGAGIFGDKNASQGVAIMKKPQSTNEYYMFYVGYKVGYISGITGVSYSVIDMNGDGGLGAVVQKNVKLIDSTSEKLALVKYCDNDNFWLITHKWDNNAFYAYPVNSSGIGVPVLSFSGEIHKDWGSKNNDEASGVLKVSPDGRKLAVSIYDSANVVEVFDFNISTGKVSNPVQLFYRHRFTYGLAFSPSGNKLYVCINGNYGVYQFDMMQHTAADILASRIKIDSSATLKGACQIGPDGKIYVAKPGLPYLDAIMYPDLPGYLCGYTSNAVSLAGRNSSFGLPAFYDQQFIRKDFTLGSDTAYCGDDSVQLSVISAQNYRYSWNTGNPDDTLSFIKVNQSGTYIVNAYNNCYSFFDTVNLDFNPIPVIQLNDSELLCYDTVVFLNASTDADSITWFPGGEKTPGIPAFIPGKYRIEVSNIFGCRAKDSIFVVNEHCPPSFHIPKAFTPNNDKNNDIFLPQYAFIDSISMQIFNRWGEKVFETTRLGEGWDGTLQGSPVQEGLYYYIIVYRKNKRSVINNGVLLLYR